MQERRRNPQLAWLIDHPRIIAVLVVALMLAITCPYSFAASGLIINGEGTAHLSWTPPDRNEDGTPFDASEIDGIVIFWGDQSRFLAGGSLRPGCFGSPLLRASTECYANALDLTDGTLTEQTLTFQLDQAVTLNFALTAVSKTNGWSKYTNEVSKSFTISTSSSSPPAAPVLQDVSFDLTCTTNVPTVTCTISVQ